MIGKRINFRNGKELRCRRGEAPATMLKKNEKTFPALMVYWTYFLGSKNVYEDKNNLAKRILTLYVQCTVLYWYLFINAH